jgi:hypothetical protein
MDYLHTIYIGKRAQEPKIKDPMAAKGDSHPFKAKLNTPQSSRDSIHLHLRATSRDIVEHSRRTKVQSYRG